MLPYRAMPGLDWMSRLLKSNSCALTTISPALMLILI